MFCCGCSLRAGAITALVLTGLSLLSHYYYGAHLLIGADAAVNQMEELNKPENKESKETVLKVMKIMGGVFLGIGVMETIVFVCLLLGIIQRKPGLVMPWLIWSMIGIVLLSLLSIGLLFVVSLAIIILLGVLAFQLYLWIVVLNYHRELKGGFPHPVVYTSQPPVYAQTTVYTSQPPVYPNQPAQYPNQGYPPNQPPEYQDTKPNLYPPMATTEKV